MTVLRANAMRPNVGARRIASSPPEWRRRESNPQYAATVTIPSISGPFWQVCRDDFRLRSACAAQRFGRTVMPTGLLVVAAPRLSVARALRT